jgi:low temperature requirement protein LtrA
MARMLRERVRGQHARVTTLELFFDLVFVFAVTQLSHSLLAHLTPVGALQAGLLTFAVWWAWIYTAWITNWLDPEHPTVRVLLFVLMGLGLVMSTSIPQAFEGRALWFAAAYVTFQLGRSLFMTWAARNDRPLFQNFIRVSTWLAVSGALWIAGGLADTLRLPLWGLALAIEYMGPAAAFWLPGMGRTDTHDWNVEGGHMAERCGLFVIICLGESVLVTGATFAGHGWDWATVAAFAAALGGAIALWWIYFSAHAEASLLAIAHSEDPGRIARTAYTYAHIPLVAGIIVTAAGDELALAHPLESAAHGGAAWLLLGGPALYLLGALWFKFAVFRVFLGPRAAGLVMLAAAAFAAPALSSLALSAVATAVLAIVAAWETALRARTGADHGAHVGTKVEA